MHASTSDPHLYRLRQVLSILSISKSAWWRGVKAGYFPQPIRLGPRTTVWRASDIHALAEFGVDWGTQRGGDHA